MSVCDEDWEEEEFTDFYDPSVDCHRCRGSGRIPTEGYESYFDAMYKPCPECRGDLCEFEPPLS